MEKLTFNPVKNSPATVTALLHTPILEMSPRRESYPAVVIAPGGGYFMVSQREAEPVALPFFARGYNVFILNYSVGENAKNFRPLIELSETLRIIRNTPNWRVDPEKIAVCGFSAGGHLAASLGTMWDDPELLKIYNNHGGQNRPNAMILSYPVILADEYTHEDSIRNVSGAEPGTPQYKYFSLDTHVSKNTCPAFLWHTVEDTTVPVENSLKFCLALSAHKIPFESHIFPKGCHGLSVCTEETGFLNAYNARWVGLAIDWLDKTFNFTL